MNENRSRIVENEPNMMTDRSEDPRVRFAIERTLLAWVRTGLALMGFGFVVARFGLFLREIEAVREGGPLKTSTGLSLWIGTVLILLGVIVNLLVSAEHLRLMRQIKSEPPYGVQSWLLGVAVSVILAILGMAMAGYLVFVSR
jgi:putative membrane protein